jgi:hypothetical protein
VITGIHAQRLSPEERSFEAKLVERTGMPFSAPGRSWPLSWELPRRA